MVDGYCMKRVVGIACFISFFGVSSGDATLATIYQWTDEHGTVGFSDDLQRVPPEHRKSAKRLEEKSSRTMLATPAITNRIVPDRPVIAPAEAGPIVSDADRYAAWLGRVDKARKDLQELKVQRQKAEDESIRMLRQVWYQWGFVDDGQFATHLAKIRDLDQQIRDKEYEIGSTIPDQARRASIPPGLLRSP
jgi:hypothetical protein